VYYLLGLPLAGQAIGPLQELVGWQEDMTTCFQGVRGGVLAPDFDKHGQTYSWLKEFQVH
jgi:hypothetical protein